jgi:hypothetical protein
MLWEMFQFIDERGLVSEKQWDELSKLLSALQQRKHKVQWTRLWEMLNSIDRHEAVSDEQWEMLYSLLDNLWHDERKNDATPEELAAHDGARNKLLN